MGFKVVSAQECRSDGDVTSDLERIEFVINEDLIAAIIGEDVCLKEGTRVKFGDRYFQDFKANVNQKKARVIR